jgi:hypothetical protein
LTQSVSVCQYVLRCLTAVRAEISEKRVTASGKLVSIRTGTRTRRRVRLLITVWALWCSLQPEYNSEQDRTFFRICIGIGKGKGKAVPLQAWSGPEGSRKLRFPDFMTTAQDGGKVVSLTHRPPSPPGNTPGTHFC